jgi:hypothetical protein
MMGFLKAILYFSLKPTPQSKSVPEDKWEVKGTLSDCLLDT